MTEPTPAEIAAFTPEQATAELARRTAAHRTEQQVMASGTEARAAAARLAGLGESAEWRQKFFNGDVATRAEWAELTRQAAGVDASGKAVAEAAPVAGFEVTTEHELPSRAKAEVTNGLIEAGFSPRSVEEIFTGKPATAEEHAMAKNYKHICESDPEWVKRLLAGGYAENRELLLCNAILSAEVE